VADRLDGDLNSEADHPVRNIDPKSTFHISGQVEFG
jgi:hypothetical protein